MDKKNIFKISKILNKSLLKQIIFSLLPMIILFGGVELVLWSIDFNFNPWTLDQPIFISADPPGTMRTAPQFVKSSPYDYPFCSAQHFTLNKPTDTIRIAVIGGSSVYFLENANKLKICLEARFKKNVEIINMGFSGAGSDRALRSASEAISLNVDILLIYTGHNEFSSITNPDTILTKEGGPIRSPLGENIRLVQFAIKLLFNLKKPEIPLKRHYNENEKMIFYKAFRNNIVKIIDIARNNNITVIIGTVAYNYYNPDDFNEETNLSVDKISSILVNNLSIDKISSMLKANPNNSFLEYTLGHSWKKSENFMLAKKFIDDSFIHETRPLKANAIINLIIKDIAREKEVPLADVYEAVAEKAPGKIPGFDLFKDRCHLNNEGNRILQGAFCDAVISSILTQKK